MLPQFVLPDDGIAAVVAALRDSICYEMLERRRHALVPAVVLRGHSVDYAACHPGSQIDVLAVGLFHPGPARLAGEVDDRAVGNAGAYGAQFCGHGPADLLHQRPVPGGRQAYAGREYGRTYGHMAVRGLLGQNNRYAEPRRIDGIVLEKVVCLNRLLWPEAVLKGLLRPGIGAEQAPEASSVLLPDEFPVCVCHHDGVVGQTLVHRPAVGAEQLAEFLLDRHPGQKVLDPFLRSE